MHLSHVFIPLPHRFRIERIGYWRFTSTPCEMFSNLFPLCLREGYFLVWFYRHSYNSFKVVAHIWRSQELTPATACAFEFFNSPEPILFKIHLLLVDRIM